MMAAKGRPVEDGGACNEALRQEALTRLDMLQKGLAPKAIFCGTPGDDIQSGTDEDDVLYGFEGADQQFGKQGDDLIFPGPGPGAARVEGGAGKDVVVLHDTGGVRFRDLYLNEALKTSIGIIETELVMDSKGNCVGSSEKN